MLLSANAIKLIQENLQSPDLQIFFNTEWGSQNPGHRELIKNHLSHLSSPLRSSISHCHEWGLVALASQEIGIDIELTARVAPQIIARVSRPSELLKAPSSASLWTAKEACFKALRSYNQPSVISKISIGDWQKIDSQTETFKLLNFSEFNSPSENKGVTIHTNGHTLSFFIFHS